MTSSATAPQSTIMDANAFKPEMIESLSASKQHLIERRASLGDSYRLFYRNPVHIVKGQGTRVWDADGAEYLDVYNNVVSVGHCNPCVIRAVTKQMKTLNTHTRYLHEGILGYAESLLSTMPAALERVMFLCTGSEANDLAIRVAQTYTGGQGIIVTSEAYHGNTALVSKLSPALGGSQELAIDMRTIPSPDSFRLSDVEMGDFMALKLREQIQDMKSHGIKFAALLVDSIFSSDGIYPHPVGFLKKMVDVVHEEGGCFIADEVQPGFSRTGESFWGFERHGVIPDLVTIGKPMANGIPCSAVIAKKEVLDPFATSIPYFNTFAGNPVSMAAAQATLDFMLEENTLGNAQAVGNAFLKLLKKMQGSYSFIGDVRGAGLYLGCEIVQPGTTTADPELALDIVEELREHHVLISVCGAQGNTLKLRPPLVFSMHDLEIFASIFEQVLQKMSK